jgi:hypothetical protein
MMWVPCKRNAFILGAEEPPIPLEGALGGHPNITQRLCAVGRVTRREGTRVIE